MARRRIPAATATLREIARVRAATGNHGKGRHPISKKDREAFKRHYKYHKGVFEPQATEGLHVIWSSEDQEFIGLCDEFPSLSWLEPTWEAALNGIKKLVAEVREDMKIDYSDIPSQAGMRFLRVKGGLK